MEPSEKAAAQLVKNSTLYKEFLAEREEILRHKWVESEKAGHDIGFEHALLDWIIKRRSAWREHRKEQLKAEEFPIPNSSTQPPRF
jgi:hypothetical protein